MISRLIVLLLIITCFLEVKSQSFEWAKNLGGTGSDRGQSVAIDASGNVYTVGAFSATADFDPGTGIYNLTASNYDVFVSKLDPNGDFVWAKKLGGSSSDNAYSIVTDNFGNVVVLGHFAGTADFNPGIGNYNLTSAGSDDVFICKLDSSGDFVWARHFGGTSYDVGYTVTVDNSGNIYTTGFFSDTADFDPGVGIYNLSASGLNEEVFVSKLDINGDFIWAKSMGGSYDDNGLDISVDNQGNVYTTGKFYQTADFDPSSNTFYMTSNGNYDVFISKLDSSGNFIWAKSIGGTGHDQGQSLSIDGLGNILLTGFYHGTVDFDPGIGVMNLSSFGGGDIFIVKLDPSGNFIWAKNVGGSANDVGYSLVLDNVGNSYLTGYFQGTSDFNPGNGIFNLSSLGNGDVFILKLKSNGNFDWAKKIGGSSGLADVGNSIARDASGNVFITGVFYGTCDFNFGSGTFNVTSNGNDDAYVVKVGVCSSPIYSSDSVLTCDSYSSPSGKYTWTTSGIYLDTLTSSFGCDSVITVDLVINHSNSSSLTEVACNSYSSPSGNYTWTNSGIFFDTLTNQNGCDSNITINLTVNHSSFLSLNEVSCYSYVSPSGKYIYTQSGIYQDTMVNNQGCDSIITVNLIINDSTSSNLSINTCDDYVSPSGKFLWITDGLYNDTVPNSLGCDSIITISLKITRLNNGITQDGHTLLSADTLANHQWIDCSNEIPILGATNISYTPTINGTYKVALIRNGCSDTSNCIEVSTIGILNRNSTNGIKLLPNPTDAWFSIFIPDDVKNSTYKLFDITGKVVKEGLCSQTKVELEIEGSKGLYFLTITSSSGKTDSFRIIKK